MEATSAGVDVTALFTDLVRLETELWNAVDARLRENCGLRMGGFDTMRLIARTPSCRVLDIASGLSITVGGASKMVDRIETAGHCVRHSDPRDLRSSIIGLTPAGESLLTTATAVVEVELRHRLGSALSAPALAELSTAITELRAVGARVDAAHADRSRPDDPLRADIEHTGRPPGHRTSRPARPGPRRHRRTTQR